MSRFHQRSSERSSININKNDSSLNRSKGGFTINGNQVEIRKSIIQPKNTESKVDKNTKSVKDPYSLPERRLSPRLEVDRSAPKVSETQSISSLSFIAAMSEAGSEPLSQSLVCEGCNITYTVPTVVLMSRVVTNCISCYRKKFLVQNVEHLKFKPDHIFGPIYLGGKRTAEDLGHLEIIKVKKIMIIGHQLVGHFPDKIDYFHVPIEDVCAEDIFKYFVPAIHFILSHQLPQILPLCSSSPDDAEVADGGDNKVDDAIEASLADGLDNVNLKGEPEEVLNDTIPSPEQEDEEIFKHLRKAEPNDQLNILIHCYAGVSRSASIVIAYLMFLNRWPFPRTLAYVKERRKAVNPNSGFIRQLQKFDRVLQQTNYSFPKLVDYYRRFVLTKKYKLH